MFQDKNGFYHQNTAGESVACAGANAMHAQYLRAKGWDPSNMPRHHIPGSITAPQPAPPWRILVCGSRKWVDRELIKDIITTVGKENIDLIIHGACVGADLLAQDVAIELGIPYLAYPADWKRQGKGAGPLRNEKMLREAKPNQVFAFHENIAESKGTADMLKRASKAGIECYVIEGDMHLC